MVVSKIAPIFLACEEGLIMSVPKRSRGRDCCGLYFENKRSSVLFLFSFNLLTEIYLHINVGQASILVMYFWLIRYRCL